MKTANFRATLAASLLVLLDTTASPALAHTQLGSLGASVAATDYYQITCSDDGSGPPASLFAQVAITSATGTPAMRHMATAGSGTVTVLLHKGNLANTSTDVAGGDAVPSPINAVNGGDGVYDVFLNKTTAGTVNYTLTFHCVTGVNGGGIHTGTDIVIKQRGAPSG